MRQSTTGLTTAVKSEPAGTETRGPLTGSYDELVRRDIATNPGFRDGLLRAALEEIRSGDAEIGRHILRKYFPAEALTGTATASG